MHVLNIMLSAKLGQPGGNNFPSSLPPEFNVGDLEWKPIQ